MEYICNWGIDLLNYIISCDWSQFLPTMVATFVGFVLAILGTWIYDAIKKCNERKNFKKDIRDELLKIQEVLRKVEVEESVAKGYNILRINPLKCYIWDSAIGADKINLLAKMSWYSELLYIYDAIKDYNEWQLLKTNKMIEGKEVCAINTHLEELKNAIILKVETISNKLNK